MKIPKRFESAKINDFNKEIAHELQRLASAKQSFMIYGDVGTGKTHAAWAVANFIGINNVKHINVPEMLAEMRLYMQVKANEAILDKFETFSTDKYLIIDDIGAEKPTDWVREHMYGIINSRYEDQLPTIITSNYTLGELSEHLGERIASRIAGMSDVIVELKGEDKRLK